MKTRTQKAKLNIFSSLFAQVSLMISGIIIPGLMIRHFGSEVYGATTSISNFLSYIALIEGGVAGVARAALYKPLADNNVEVISKVYNEIKHFFYTIGLAFIFYTILIAVFYNYIAKDVRFDWTFSFLLVIVISIATIGQYFLGITNTVLLQADQKHYINNALIAATTIINVIIIFVLIRLNSGIIFVKLVSSIVFLIRPALLAIYVKRGYEIKSNCKNGTKETALSQKWTALGQHIAYFLHTNTDVVVLTLFVNLKIVAVYSVYNMVVSSIRNFISSFYSGLEAVLGDLYARKEMEKLNSVFSCYETMISIISVCLFSCTAILIKPFVKLYTEGVTDVNYIIPALGFSLIAAELVYTLIIPYHYMINAAGRFKQTKIAAYGEAVINILLSVILVFRFGVVGVAIATLIATVFRSINYAYYLVKHVLHRPIHYFVSRSCINIITFCLLAFGGYYIFNTITINGYFQWGVFGFVVFIFSFLLIFCVNWLFYKEDIKTIFNKIIHK